jgi:hypothetical protein
MLSARQAEATRTSPPTRVDVERVVQWALQPGKAGGIPWREGAALAFDLGVTAKPRRRQRGGWALVIAGGVKTPIRRVELEAVADDDAGRVMDSIRALPGNVASLVIHHGRYCTRPGWTERVENRAPRLGPSGRPWVEYADPRRRMQPYCPLLVTHEWVVSDAAISRYRAWWGGLLIVAEAIRGRLDRWEVSGFAAPQTPWMA